MTTYAFLTLPAYGHVNPSLAIAQELVTRGQTVNYYLPEEFRTTVEATGAMLRPYNSMLMQRIANMSPMLGEESRLVLPQVLERMHTEPPDVIVHEPVCVWTRILTPILKVPAVALRPTYAMNEHFNMFSLRAQLPQDRMSQMRTVLEKAQADIADLCTQYQVPPFDFFGIFLYAEPLNIVFLPRAFQPAGDTFDERFVFVGPSIATRREATDFPLKRLDASHPLLYISLGTIFNNQPAFFKQCFAAFDQSGYQVVMSRGKRIDSATLEPVPEHFLVAPYVPQLEILSRAQVFLTHGGMNSVMESLYYRVPMIVVPQMPEQAVTARRVAEMGLGLMLEKEAVTVEGLREAVEQVANDGSIRQNIARMQQLTRAAGGYQRATDAIMQFAIQQIKQ